MFEVPTGYLGRRSRRPLTLQQYWERGRFHCRVFGRQPGELERARERGSSRVRGEAAKAWLQLKEQDFQNLTNFTEVTLSHSSPHCTPPSGFSGSQHPFSRPGMLCSDASCITVLEKARLEKEREVQKSLFIQIQAITPIRSSPVCTPFSSQAVRSVELIWKSRK